MTQLDDFRNFLFLVWDHLRLPEPTPVQYDMAHWLQTGPQRAVIEAFRGVGKSWITSAFVLWSLYHNPQMNILVVSASKQRADDFSTFTLRLINEMPVLAHLRPREDQRNSKISFDVGPARAAHAPSVKSAGITGQLSGSRADLIVADDIEVPNNSQTQLMREKLSEAVKEFEAIIKPGGRIVFLGTPQTEQSVYNTLEGRGYTTRIWPAQYPDAKLRSFYGDRLSSLIAEATTGKEGKSTDPKRFTDMDLMERLTSYGGSGFQLQFMLNTSLSDAERYPLRVRDLIVMACDPAKAPSKPVWASDPDHVINDLPNLAMNGDRYHRPMALIEPWVDYTGAVLAIDPAGRGKDETGYAVVKHLHGYLYVVACGGLKGYGIDTLKALSVLAKIHQVKFIRIESNFGDGMFSALLQPILANIYPCTIEEERHHTQKEVRIADALEPVMASHRLVIDPRVIDQDYKSIQSLPTETASTYSLIYQMTRLTREKGALAHDDRLDALAIAVQYWTEHLAQDANKQRLERKNELLDQELEKFMDGCRAAGTYRAPRRPTRWQDTGLR